MLSILTSCREARGHEAGHDVNRDREHNGRVILGGDAVQCLQISQLKHHSIEMGARVEGSLSPVMLLDCPQ